MLSYNKVLANISKKEFISALEKMITSPYFGEYELRGDNQITSQKEFGLEIRGNMKALGKGYSFPTVKKMSGIIVSALRAIEIPGDKDLDLQVRLTVYPSTKLYTSLGITQSDRDDLELPLHIGNDLMIVKNDHGHLALGFGNLGLKDYCTNKRYISALKTLHGQWGYHLGKLFPGKIENSNEVYSRQRMEKK